MTQQTEALCLAIEAHKGALIPKSKVLELLATLPAAGAALTAEQMRPHFEWWWTTRGIFPPIGSPECAAAWSAWIASGHYTEPGGWKVSPMPWGYEPFARATLPAEGTEPVGRCARLTDECECAQEAKAGCVTWHPATPSSAQKKQALTPIRPHDHPEPQVLAWSDTEIAWIRRYAADAVATALATPSSDAQDAARYRRVRRMLRWQINPNRVATDEEVDSYVDTAQMPAGSGAAMSKGGGA